MADQLRKDDVNYTAMPGEDIRTTTPGAPGEDIRTGKDENRDPITEAPGAHPVGVGVGAAGAGASGALIGSVAGRGGPAVGAGGGAGAGGLAGERGGEGGESTAGAANPGRRDEKWQL